MHHTIKDKNQSIWIAQREGRAKDSNDRTQESVLKMLAIGGEGHLVDRLTEMDIVPLAISYEYDPCDYLKAQEFQQKRDNPEYKKTQADDLKNMQTGLFGFKGRVHFQVAECINGELAKLDRSLPTTACRAAKLLPTATLPKRSSTSWNISTANWIVSSWNTKTSLSCARSCCRCMPTH